MTQTVKGQKNTPSKQNKPGQRQQDRLNRLARRRRRQRIWMSILVAIVVVALAGVTFWQYQRITTQQAADRAAKASAAATAAAIASATATAQNCFISPAGTKPDTIYSGVATPAAGPTTSPHIIGTPVVLKDGLKYVDIKVGSGATAKKGNTVSVEYTGWFAATCKKFSSSYDPGGQAFPLMLGQGQTIKGFDEGLTGMQAGGIRRILIPAALGYGAKGQQNQQGQQIIPPNATLIFDVTVVHVK